MAFLINRPKPSDTFDDSQEYIQGNFAAIKEAFDVNHEALTGAGGDEGKHKFVELLKVEDSDIPSTKVNEGLLFTKKGPLAGLLDLYFKRESDGNEINLTESGQFFNGFQRLSSGILLKWGSFRVATNVESGVVDFGNIPAFTAFYQVFANVIGEFPPEQVNDINAWVYINQPSINGFNWDLRRRNLANTGGTDRGISLVNWLAIGA